MLVQYVISGLIIGILYSLLAIGFALVYNTTKVFHIATAAVQIFAKKLLVEKVISVIQIVGGIFIALLPGVIAPVCDMKSMHCYVYTRPFIVIVGIVLAGVAVVDFIIRGKKNGNPSKI